MFLSYIIFFIIAHLYFIYLLCKLGFQDVSLGYLFFFPCKKAMNFTTFIDI